MRLLPAILIFIILLSSCKTKYEELLSRYNTTLNRKKELIKERKILENKIIAANDSVKALLPEYYFWKRYTAESAEIAGLKSDFIKKNLKP
ncbi:MAG: hypothetical protein WCL06_03685 [Bacteroidota bacterium]